MGRIGVLLDQNIGSRRLLACLQSLGCARVYIASQTGLTRPEDEELVEWAGDRGLLFVTNDAGVANTQRFQVCEHAGIVRVKFRRGLDFLAQRLEAFVTGDHVVKCLHALVILEEHRFKVVGAKATEIFPY